MKMNTLKRTAMKAVAFLAAVYTAGMVSADAEETESILRIEDGALQPVWDVTDLRDPYYTNEDSDILRFCVYVETDNDTDNDGKADLVKTLVPGHHLSLVLTTWDPYQAFLDESFEAYDLEKTSEAIDYDYSYIIDNNAIRVRMPLV